MAVTGEFRGGEIRQIMKKKYFFSSLKIKKWQLRFQAKRKIERFSFFTIVITIVIPYFTIFRQPEISEIPAYSKSVF